MAQDSFKWTFERLGGMNQTVLATAEELRHLRELDPKLWVSLACPTKGLEFDADTLALIDTDHDRRVRIPEVLDAVDFVCAKLTDPDLLMTAPDAITPSDIADAELADAARAILQMHGLAGNKPLTLAMVRGAVSVRNAAAYKTWQIKYESAPKPLGADTDDALALYHDLAAKIDDYFLRCRMAKYAPNVEGALNAETAMTTTAEQTVISEESLAALPLAHVNAEGVLDSALGINPQWSAKLFRFTVMVRPFLQTEGVITASDWESIRKALDTYDGLKTAAPEKVECEVPDNIREIDDATLGELERLLLYVRHLYRLLNNFVSFREFYSMNGTAAFQTGTLYIDGRACHLCLNAENPDTHLPIAKLSQLCLAYCTCKRNAGGVSERLDIVAAITSGNDDFLMEGRNGVFIDNRGHDWDATLTKVERNPISLRDAVWSPYRRISQLLGNQLAKFATNKRNAAITNISKTIGANASNLVAGTQPAPFDMGKSVGILAAVGIALGALGTAIGSIAAALLALKWWQLPLLIFGIFAVISGPSVLLAWLKLRRRTLAPLLEASGWALNSQLPISLTLANALTTCASLPKNGSVRKNRDPFKDQESHPWLNILLLIILGGVIFGLWLWQTDRLKGILPF